LLLFNKISLFIKTNFEKEYYNPFLLALFTPIIIPNPFIAYKPNITKLPNILTLFTLSSYNIILIIIIYILFSH